MSFSVVNDAAWAPGVQSRDAWLHWATNHHKITGNTAPTVELMPALLRRRAGFLGKMALEVAYKCLGSHSDVPIVFASRHGDTSRVVELLLELARNGCVSPASFGLSVHNAIGGLFSIARSDRAGMMALAGGNSTIEYAVLEACSLIHEGAGLVLLVAYDCPLPSVYGAFAESNEQPYAWAWLMRPRGDKFLTLSCSTCDVNAPEPADPPGLEVLRFYLRQDSRLERYSGGRKWLWTRSG